MVSLYYFRCERSHVEINGMEQNMLREDQALPIRGIDSHKRAKARSNIHNKTVYRRGDRFH